MNALRTEILALPDFQGPAPTAREDLLFRVLARVTTVFLYRETETYNWASQVALLDHLNRQRLGDTLGNLKTRFYDPLAALMPPLVANHPFDQYLHFLVDKQHMTINGDAAKITAIGIDYLAWRVSTNAPPRLVG